MGFWAGFFLGFMIGGFVATIVFLIMWLANVPCEPLDLDAETTHGMPPYSR